MSASIDEPRVTDEIDCTATDNANAPPPNVAPVGETLAFQAEIDQMLCACSDRTPSLLQRCWVVDGKQPSENQGPLRFRCTEAA